MPPDTEVFTLNYHYERFSESETPFQNGVFTAWHESNVIDLGIIAPDGQQVGASGSDKQAIEISATAATPGYRPWQLTPGEWHILLGAYKVASEGVTVTYQLTFTPKQRRLLKGDLHTHTLASDGVLTAEELACLAQRNGLDFLAITDHNQMVSADGLPRLPGFTLIPGVEWTHYQGHANFLGVDQPYNEPFFTNTFEDTRRCFATARQRGALITINHPFEESCPFHFDLNALPFDCLEIWNGPFRESNFRAAGLWHSMLLAGKKIPICGGSDYHRNHPFIFVGGPTTCVSAISSSPADILSALRHGHAYITFSPEGPELELTAGDAILGDSVSFADTRSIQIAARGLKTGDILQVVIAQGSVPVLKSEAPGDVRVEYTLQAPGFARVEILRSFLPGLPMLPALISNPIYFD